MEGLDFMKLLKACELYVGAGETKHGSLFHWIK